MAEWYVEAGAGGGGDGSSGSPWTFAEGVAADNGGAVGNGDRVNIKTDGTYTIPNTTWTRVAGASSYITWQGMDAVPGDGGRPTIVRQAGEVGTWLNNEAAHYHDYIDFKFDANSVGNNVGFGVQPSPTSLLLRCEFHNMTAFASYSVDDGYTVDCFFYNCKTVTGVVAANCLFDGVTKAFNGFYASQIYNCIVTRANWAFNNSWVEGCLAYDCLQGFNNANYSYWAVNCIAAECDTRGYTGANQWVAMNCCSFNNVGADNAAILFINKSTVDPQFVDPTAPAYDFRRTGSNLDGSGLSVVGTQTPDYGIDIGPDQAKVTIPVIGNVRDGVTVGRAANLGTGVLDLPSITRVRNLVKFDNETKTGVDVSPDNADVRQTVGYGAYGTEEEGTLDDLVLQTSVEVEVVDDGLEVEVEVSDE